MNGKGALAVLVLAVAGLATLGQNDCQGRFDPVFNATGTYTGTWQGTTTDDQEAQPCPLMIELEHDVDAGPIANRTIRGTVTIDFSCIELPEGANPLEAGVVQATFFLDDEGNLNSIIPGCANDAPICVALGLQGTGADSDDDGFMDAYAGIWAYRLLLPGIPAFGVDGTFQVEAVSEGGV